MPTLPSFNTIVEWAKTESGYEVTRHPIDDADYPSELIIFEEDWKRFSVPHSTLTPNDWGDWDTLVEKLADHEDMSFHSLIQVVMDWENDNQPDTRTKTLTMGKKRLCQYQKLMADVRLFRHTVKVKELGLYPADGLSWNLVAERYERLIGALNELDIMGNEGDLYLSDLANLKRNSDFLLEICEALGFTQQEIDARDDFYSLCSQAKFKIQEFSLNNSREALTKLAMKYLHWDENQAKNYPANMILDSLQRVIDSYVFEHERDMAHLKEISRAMNMSEAFTSNLSRIGLTSALVQRSKELLRNRDFSEAYDYLFSVLTRSADIDANKLGKSVTPLDLMKMVENKIQALNYQNSKHVEWMTTIAREFSVTIKPEDTPMMIMKNVIDRINKIDSHITQALNIWQDPGADDED